jgi:hypothetical protein
MQGKRCEVTYCTTIAGGTEFMENTMFCDKRVWQPDSTLGAILLLTGWSPPPLAP